MKRVELTTTNFDPKALNGLEVGPVTLIGEATWHEDSDEWRCLANWRGALVVVALQIRVKGAK